MWFEAKSCFYLKALGDQPGAVAAVNSTSFFIFYTHIQLLRSQHTSPVVCGYCFPESLPLTLNWFWGTQLTADVFGNL